MKEFWFLSSDEKTKIHCVAWPTISKPKAVLQLSHGMAEHIRRYDRFATFLSKSGILVVGNSHLGHGLSVNSKDDLGHLENDDTFKNLVLDMKKLHLLVSSRHPNIPYFIFGHSMGSFLCRAFIENYGNEIDGAIIEGTAHHSEIALNLAKKMCKFRTKVRNPRFRSKLFNSIAFKNYNRYFSTNRSNNAWITKSNSTLDNYEKDKKCGFIFTLNGIYNLLNLLEYNEKHENINRIPKTLPILIISGEQDPIGNYGAGPKIVYKQYKKANITDVELRLYPNDRHELLNETNYREIERDILKWLISKIKKL